MAPQEVDAQPWVPGTGPQEGTEQEYKPCPPWKSPPGRPHWLVGADLCQELGARS